MEKQGKEQTVVQTGDYLLSMWLAEDFRSLHNMWAPVEREDAEASA